MDDTKLLELAGKAAGEQYGPDRSPLERDDLALRLAVKLNLTVVCEPHETEVFSEGECFASEAIYRMSMVATSAEVTDPYAATRRAIVRAAAALEPTPND